MKDLCAIYQVPSQLLNDSSASTYNNVREARKALITNACLPLKEAIKGLLNKHFISSWNKELGKNLYVDFDINDYTELTDDLDSLYARANSSQFLSVNEKRVMTGFDPIDNPLFDEPMMPLGVIPASEFNSMDDENDQ